MTETRERIPAHLSRFVALQDYGAYDEIDQAVWRFILLQTHARLSKTAHPAYSQGLHQTGISVERVPRIAEMDECLSRYGWGAVAVDGFIPPRAFQEFQALRILTIAADIRSSDHLAYTPAPDIVHEAAGHAPILPDPDYRAYLQRFGEVGARAFSSPEDRHLDRAIHRLSALKEDPSAAPERVAAAECSLVEATGAIHRQSEVALLSRLHWWTVEYGLVGTPSHYQLYGAGLLSSLGESHFCHHPKIAKLPLSTACLETGYDITRPQPQLFVAQCFAQLDAVLEEVADGFAQRLGGAVALERALASGEVATLELSTGLQLIGVLAGVRGGAARPEYLQLTGPCALARRGTLLEGHGPARHPEGFGMPLGRLRDGTALSQLRERDLARYADSGAPGALRLRYASGVEVAGRIERLVADPQGRLSLLTLGECRVTCADELLFDPAWGEYDLAVAESVGLAYAGAVDPAYWPVDDSKTAPAPTRRSREREDEQILDLYREALQLWENPQADDLVARFGDLADALSESFPDRWLLRWNLLECLQKVGRAGEELAIRLREELLAIEKQRPRDLPISMGLRYLDELDAPG